MALVRRVALPELADGRGRLMFAEVDHHIPFAVRRMFAIYGVASGQERAVRAPDKSPIPRDAFRTLHGRY